MNKINNLKRNVVVTGGAGFIGSHLSEALLSKGFSVHIIDNLSTGRKENVSHGAIFYEVDIRNENEVDKVFESIHDVYCVFHCAAIPMVQFSIDNPQESHNININGTHNVLLSSVKHKVRRVVYSASCSVYGDQEIMPLVENMSVAPKSPYALQKYWGEKTCSTYSKVYGVETVSLRYFNVYGVGQNPDGNYAMLIAKFVSQSQKGEPMTITGTGDQTRDFIYVSDVVDANLKAADSNMVGRGEVINIGSGRNTSVNEVAKMIGGEVKYIEARLEPKDALADISKAKELLGWEPKIGIEQGIRFIKINNQASLHI